MGQNSRQPRRNHRYANVMYGVAARIGADFVARLANIDILAAPRFASSPILAATHTCLAKF
jgi:hypothetical protein